MKESRNTSVEQVIPNLTSNVCCIYGHYRKLLSEQDGVKARRDELQISRSRLVMQVGLAYITWCTFTECTVHVASRPGQRFTVGGRNWLRLKMRGTENKVAQRALTQQSVVICFRLPSESQRAPHAEGDHDPPEQQLCSPPAPYLA